MVIYKSLNITIGIRYFVLQFLRSGTLILYHSLIQNKNSIYIYGILHKFLTVWICAIYIMINYKKPLPIDIFYLVIYTIIMNVIFFCTPNKTSMSKRKTGTEKCQLLTSKLLILFVYVNKYIWNSKSYF